MTLLEKAAAALGVEGMTPLTAIAAQKKLGKGTVGGASVVLKVVVVAGGTTDEQFERARREVELLASITSPNVVRVVSDLVEVDEGSDKGVAWVEEFIDGDDLRARLSSVPWPETETLDMMRQVAAGIAELHERRVIHRDLSPGNIMLTSDGVFKIIDPGYARFLDEVTITRGQPGTYGFMSPEHVSPVARPLMASDIFTIGAIAFLTVTGVLPVPFDGNEARYIHLLGNLTVPSLRDTNPAMNLGLADVIDRCLHPQPARRYMDGSELMEGLVGL